MGVYLPDGEMYAGWSTGRWLALWAVISLIVAGTGYAVLHEPHTSTPTASDQMVALYAEWVGGGLFVLMGIAALGSLQISWKERGGVEVTAAGVTRLYSERSREFLPREQIAGFVRRIGGGVALVDARRRARMVIPRSIEGYRDCIAELKGMGIQGLPGGQAPQALTWKSMNWKERVQFLCLSTAFGCFARDESVVGNCIVGTIFVVGVVWIAIDHRKKEDLGRWFGVVGASMLIVGFRGLARLW